LTPLIGYLEGYLGVLHRGGGHPETALRIRGQGRAKGPRLSAKSYTACPTGPEILAPVLNPALLAVLVLAPDIQESHMGGSVALE